ncbi:MAG TPA: hypothetical protein DDW76_10155 [Cyanobacteria bacterium UBA11369]|nr:hypothetical protein [Cyanobacteria bacterium UBA11371]HBE19399.1 hypothetical protein [Cyanobacteria bacterium UBA11367]HBE34639.1 hypothetical protein [Cyanobacteria bacterium UBA11368]HBE49136.1 hypothetical protein [Cyanobacteria bacterium UBA11369]
MKGRSILSLMVCLGVLGTSLLPTLAQSRSRRYPTNAEIQRIIREFQQRASSRPFAGECCGGWEQDDRTAAQKRSLESFVRAWSRINPNVTTFLGTPNAGITSALKKQSKLLDLFLFYDPSN